MITTETFKVIRQASKILPDQTKLELLARLDQHIEKINTGWSEAIKKNGHLRILPNYQLK